MKIAYRPKLHLSKKNLTQLAIVNNIIEEYRDMGYKLTLRQLYYQLVSRDVIPNKTKEYDKLSVLLVKGRMGGVVDWSAIEDRIRVPNIPYAVENPDDAIKDTIDSYRLDRMKGQKNYIELWVEKDALSSVLKTKTHHYHIRLMVNRGYSSCTAMHDAFNRFKRAAEGEQTPHLIYLGDADPSGMDMVRDIDERLEEFGIKLDVHHAALTMKQVKQHDPPPNPAKVTDPRAKKYIAKYGNTSWEVDALNPPILHKIIEKEVESLLDMDMFNDMLIQEEKETVEISKLPIYKDGLLDIAKYVDNRIKNIKEDTKKLSKKDKDNNLHLQVSFQNMRDYIKTTYQI